MDHATAKIDLAPGQPEQLGVAHPGVQRGRDQRAVGLQAGIEQRLDLATAEYPVGQPGRMRALVGFELVDGAVCDPSVANREAHDALQGRQGTCDRVLRASLLAQSVEQLADFLHPDLAQGPAGERG